MEVNKVNSAFLMHTLAALLDVEWKKFSYDLMKISKWEQLDVKELMRKDWKR